MAKKQRGQRASPESSTTVTGFQCATTGGGGGGNILETVEDLLGELFCGQKCVWENETGLPAFQHDPTGSSFDLSYNTFPLRLSTTTELMHKQKTGRDDNTGQQAEATVADDSSVALSTAFPHFWFERPFFANYATSSNASNSALTSSSDGVGCGPVDIIYPMAQGADGGGLDGRIQPQVSVSPCASSSSPAAESGVDSRPASTTWRVKNEGQSPSTSFTYHQSFQPSNKQRKKRPSGASVDVFSDSDGSDDDDDDDGSLSDVEEDEEAIRSNSQQFTAKFLELRSSGKPCNFWQYNSQARGPKGRRIYGEIILKDCHVLDEFSDPVTHGGSGKGQPNKLRHGEGNDPRPDTDKLMEIGSRICRLEEEFRRLSAVKTGCKDEVGRQKNKLASRICRLKKKAQHEANKVKLEGLREEHEQLVAVVAKLVTIMEAHFLTHGTMGTTPLVQAPRPSYCSQLECLIQSHLKFMIAGHTAEYVNMQLQKSAERLRSNSRTPV